MAKQGKQTPLSMETHTELTYADLQAMGLDDAPAIQITLTEHQKSYIGILPPVKDGGYVLVQGPRFGAISLTAPGNLCFTPDVVMKETYPQVIYPHIKVLKYDAVSREILTLNFKLEQDPLAQIAPEHKKVQTGPLLKSLSLSDIAPHERLAGALIRIENYRGDEDELALLEDLPEGVSIVSNSGGLLVLSGVVPARVYQKVFQSVAYKNTATTPTLKPRVIDFEVSDGMKLRSVAQVQPSLTQYAQAEAAEDTALYPLAPHLRDSKKGEEEKTLISATLMLQGEGDVDFSVSDLPEGVTVTQQDKSLILVGAAPLKEYLKALSKISLKAPFLFQGKILFYISDGMRVAQLETVELAVGPAHLAAQEAAAPTGEVFTKTPGVHFLPFEYILEATAVQKAIVTITDFVAGEESLRLESQLPAGLSLEAFSPDQITISGEASTTRYQELISKIAYQHFREDKKPSWKTVLVMLEAFGKTTEFAYRYIPDREEFVEEALSETVPAVTEEWVTPEASFQMPLQDYTLGDMQVTQAFHAEQTHEIPVEFLHIPVEETAPTSVVEAAPILTPTFPTRFATPEHLLIPVEHPPFYHEVETRAVGLKDLFEKKKRGRKPKEAEPVLLDSPYAYYQALEAEAPIPLHYEEEKPEEPKKTKHYIPADSPFSHYQATDGVPESELYYEVEEHLEPEEPKKPKKEKKKKAEAKKQETPPKKKRRTRKKKPLPEAKSELQELLDSLEEFLE